MGPSEKSVLACLTLILLAFSVIAETRVLDSAASPSQGPWWQAQIGLYLPFVMFALVSTYHFLDWARKHKRRAILLGVVLVSVASLLGVGSANTPRPLADTGTFPTRLLTISQPQSSGSVEGFAQQLPSFQNSLITLQKVLNSTPYYSTGANVLVILASLATLAFVLFRMKRERSVATAPILTPSLIEQPRAGLPREMVIHYYALACGRLQASGIRIPESDTPFDIHARTKAMKPTIANSLWKLTTLFEEAKFSLHSMSRAEAEEANACFSEIQDSLSGT